MVSCGFPRKNCSRHSVIITLRKQHDAACLGCAAGFVTAAACWPCSLSAGHKLFQSNFIGIVIGEVSGGKGMCMRGACTASQHGGHPSNLQATNFKRKLYTLLNSGIALIGCEFAHWVVAGRPVLLVLLLRPRSLPARFN